MPKVNGRKGDRVVFPGMVWGWGLRQCSKLCDLAEKAKMGTWVAVGKTRAKGETWAGLMHPT